MKDWIGVWKGIPIGISRDISRNLSIKEGLCIIIQGALVEIPEQNALLIGEEPSAANLASSSENVSHEITRQRLGGIRLIIQLDIIIFPYISNLFWKAMRY